jgi:hypothetical protein
MNRLIFLGLTLIQITALADVSEIYCSSLGKGRQRYDRVTIRISEHPLDPAKKLIDVLAPESQIQSYVYSMKPELRTKTVGGVTKTYYAFTYVTNTVTSATSLNAAGIQANYGKSDTNEVHQFFVQDNAGNDIDFYITTELSTSSSRYATVAIGTLEGLQSAKYCNVVK